MKFLFLKWRDRLVVALREMKAGGLAEQALHQVCKVNGGLEVGQEDTSVIKVLTHFLLLYLC